MELKEQLTASIEGVENGETPALKFLAELKTIEELVKSLRERCLPFAIEELDNCVGSKEKSYKIYGCEFSFTAGCQYKYDNSPAWVEQNEKLVAIQEQMKAAQKLGHAIVNEETGEVYEMARRIDNKRSIAVKIK